MLEILQFVFSSFWIWLGSLMMLTVIAVGIGEGLTSLRK